MLTFEVMSESSLLTHTMKVIAIFRVIKLNGCMDGNFQDYSYNQDFEADFP